MSVSCGDPPWNVPAKIRLDSGWTTEIVKNAPDAHARAGDGRQLDGARETLVTLGVIVLQTDLKLNGLEEVTLLLVERVLQQLLDILAHSG